MSQAPGSGDRGVQWSLVRVFPPFALTSLSPSPPLCQLKSDEAYLILSAERDALPSESTMLLRGKWGRERGGFVSAVLEGLKFAQGQPDLLFLEVSDTSRHSTARQALV